MSNGYELDELVRNMIIGDEISIKCDHSNYTIKYKNKNEELGTVNKERIISRLEMNNRMDSFIGHVIMGLQGKIIGAVFGKASLWMSSRDR